MFTLLGLSRIQPSAQHDFDALLILDKEGVGVIEEIEEEREGPEYMNRARKAAGMTR